MATRPLRRRASRRTRRGRASRSSCVGLLAGCTRRHRRTAARRTRATSRATAPSTQVARGRPRGPGRRSPARTLDGEPLRRRRPPRRGRRRQRLGLVVPAVHRRGAGAAEVWEQTKAEGVQFVGINIRDDRDRGPGARAPVRRHLPEHRRRRRASCCCSCAAPCRRAPIPTTLVLDRQGRVAARVLGEVDAHGTLRGAGGRRRSREPGRARHRRMSVGDTITDGSLLLAAAARGRRRAGVVPVAVRAAAGARLPVLRHRAAGGRGLRRAPRRRGAAASPARCCSCSASPSSSSAPACCSAASASFLLEHQRRAAARARRADHRARPGLRRAPCRGCSATCGSHRTARRRAGRRAGARRAVRARLDAVHRPDARRGAGAGPRRGHRRCAAACSPSPTASASGSVRADRARLQPGDGRVRLGQAALRWRSCASAAGCSSSIGVLLVTGAVERPHGRSCRSGSTASPGGLSDGRRRR